MSNYYPDDEAIERLARGLLSRSLTKEQWTHAAHFASTLWFLRNLSHMQLETALAPIIRAHNQVIGVQNTDSSGYHETITQASLQAARAFLAAQPPARPLHLIVDLLMASPLGRSDWILTYWSKERLFTPEARRSWVPPDLRHFAPYAGCGWPDAGLGEVWTRSDLARPASRLRSRTLADKY